MNFIALQKTVRDAIAAHATFLADAAGTVIADVGHAKPILEKSLQDKGYSIAVWPPVKGEAFGELAGIDGVNSTIVVRIQFEPHKLAEQTDPSAWMNQRITAVVEAILSIQEEVGGTKFRLVNEAFELMNFDEGLVAYHIRFERLAVFGQ
jgi:hypothetical protein